MKKALFLALIFLVPSFVFAAGFAKESLFLSRSSVTQGESVILYAPLSNPSEDDFSGKVLFSEGSTTIGSVSASLSAGEARIVSVSWTPTEAGTHKLSAKLELKDGTVEDELSGQFSVAPKPAAQVKAEEQSAATIETSQGIQDNIEKISPPVATYVSPAFTIIDSVRNSAADVLDNQLNSTKQGLGPNGGSLGDVLGSEATKNATKNPVGAFMYFLKLLYFYLLTLLRFIVGSAAVFYPIFAIVFLWMLWKIFNRFRRPAY